MPRPSVLHPVALPGFLRHLIDHHAAPTSLVVCSSRDAFEQHLLYCLESSRSSKSVAPEGVQDAKSGPEDQQRSSPLPSAISDEFLLPTLHNLSSTSTIRLVFCTSLESLRAYLSLLATSATDKPSTPSDSVPGQPKSNDDAYPALALLNPVALHKETTSHSAQGLSRTLAIAVEAAAHRRQRLLIAECPVPYHLRERRHTDWADEVDGQEFGTEDNDGAGGQGAEAGEREVGAEPGDVHMGGIMLEEEDPWAEKLSILNVTTKSFGLGDRAWLGRTVSARQVAERWCRFARP